MQAWNLANPVAEPYREFADRWGNAEFAKYVDILEQQADEAMQDADQVSSLLSTGSLRVYILSSNLLVCIEAWCSACLEGAPWHLIH